ncbi:MAG: manganese efflux pump MntP family protein [Candidatus Bathyarchaeota archaeon]|nr:manganese efflux pump MntP family protein [Candidatus Bathyarchaeota archaeon]
MDAFTVVLIAVGLAMDAFAVSIANGMTITRNRRRSALLTATAFGGFQMLMPAIGYLAGLSLESIIASVDHWVAFGLLAFIGAKMFFDGSKKEKPQDGPTDLKMRTLLVLAVATSIDALMVGLSFAFLQTQIAVPIAVIGGVTFGLSFVGFYFGCGLGKQFGHRIKIVGGAVLILIGLRILLEHLFA